MTTLQSAIWFVAAVVCGGASAALGAYLILLGSEPSAVLHSMRPLDLPTLLGSITGGALALLRIFRRK